MTLWPSAKIASLEARLLSLEERCRRAEHDRDYWQAKTERLLDMALYRRGEITAPVFEPTKEPAEVSPLLRVIGAMNTHVTDSSKRPLASKAEPISPMT